jgi:predicted AAA+ superfamily ATPase
MLISNDPNEELKKLSSPKIRLSPAASRYRKRWEYYLHWGGMPRLLAETWDDEDRFAWLLDYQKTFLQRDVPDLARLANLEPFSKAQKIAALNTAQLINFSELARNASITSPTAQRFMQYLEMSYQIILLPPWLKNKTKRLVKMPKLHFLDPGVRRAILGKRGKIDGMEFESAVVSEIYKQCRTPQLTIDFYHFRTYDGREVDILLELEKGYIAIECKSSENVSTADTRHLKELNTILDKPLLLSLVVSNDANIRLLNKEQNIWNVPAFMLLA